jgi:hypothetical protein
MEDVLGLRASVVVTWLSAEVRSPMNKGMTVSSIASLALFPGRPDDTPSDPACGVAASGAFLPACGGTSDYASAVCSLPPYARGLKVRSADEIGEGA